MRKPASRAIRAEAANCAAMSPISPVDSGCGSVAPATKGMALGATVCHPPSCGAIGLPPSHGRWLDALRPAWASWIPGTAPHAVITAASRVSSAWCGAFHSPRQPGVIRPIAETCVASVNTIPAPPAARAPRCWICQSPPNPSVALYWHMGATVTRLRAVTERNVMGWNRGGVAMRILVLTAVRGRF